MTRRAGFQAPGAACPGTAGRNPVGVGELRHCSRGSLRSSGNPGLLDVAPLGQRGSPGDGGRAGNCGLWDVAPLGQRHPSGYGGHAGKAGHWDVAPSGQLGE